MIVKITIVKFAVFNSDSTDRHEDDKGLFEKPFYNKEPQECVDEIRSTIWETAQIKEIVEYDIMKDGTRKIELSTLEDNGPDHSKHRS